MLKNIFSFFTIVLFASMVLLPVASSAQGTRFSPSSGGSTTTPPPPSLPSSTTTTTSATSTNGTSVGCIEAFRTNETLGGVFEYATCLISTAIIPLIFAIATVVFIWGVVQYVINSEDEAKKDKGRQFMIWGLIGLFVMLCVWGLVEILGNTFGVDTTFVPKVKQQP